MSSLRVIGIRIRSGNQIANSARDGAIGFGVFEFCLANRNEIAQLLAERLDLIDCEAPQDVLGTAGIFPFGLGEQYFATLQEYGPRFRPHFVVISVCPNDVGHGGADAGMASRMAAAGMDDPEQVAQMVEMMGSAFRDNAPVSAAEAATMMLDAVRDGRWRVLLGDDARALDEAVRADPEGIYGAGGLTHEGIRP
jgi:hypothetical protein